VLRNRAFDTVDWNTERENRCDIKTVPISSADVYQRAARIFSMALKHGKRPQKFGWRDYWNIRWSRLPGGSVVSQYDDDKRLKASLPLEARIKSAWFSACPMEEHEQWYVRTPSIYASTSTKYEWGKVRALYGCDVTSFLHSDFAMANCEDVLPQYFPVGRAATEDNISAAMATFDETLPVCFDYDDFNSQHSNTSMTAVLMAWRDVFRPYLSREQVMSMDWTIDSINNVTVQFNELGQQVTTRGTLMSGWRLTSFMNTVLNRIYLEHAGMKDLVVYALHNGDDMFAGARNMADAVCLIKQAKARGIRAQVAKTNLGTIGEFLRVDTRAAQPSAKQYLSRSIATAAHGRVETSAPFDMCALISAHKERADAIITRGGNPYVVQAMLKQQLSL